MTLDMCVCPVTILIFPFFEFAASEPVLFAGRLRIVFSVTCVIFTFDCCIWCSFDEMYGLSVGGQRLVGCGVL